MSESIIQSVRGQRPLLGTVRGHEFYGKMFDGEVFRRVESFWSTLRCKRSLEGLQVEWSIKDLRSRVNFDDVVRHNDKNRFRRSLKLLVFLGLLSRDQFQVTEHKNVNKHVSQNIKILQYTLLCKCLDREDLTLLIIVQPKRTINVQILDA